MSACLNGRDHAAALRTARAAFVAVLTLLAATVAATPASALEPDDRFALVNQCVDLRSQSLGRTVATDGGPFRMQATDLGKYLIYGKAGTFLAADANGGTVGQAAEPSPQADWRIDVRGDAFTLTLASGKALTTDGTGRLVVGDTPGEFTFPKADGCAVYPESDTDVVGEPTRGESPFGETQGLMETHLHWMAFELFGGGGHCGRPWSPYGVASAMVDCPDHKPGGFGLAFENGLSGKSPGATHDTVGWPTFKDWPEPTSLTHEGTYYRWVERAYRGGMRLIVDLFAEAGALCEIQPRKTRNCNEMDAVRVEIKQLRKLRDYIDAQSGGPGKGWMQIVKDPFEARRVINDGKLAVIMGVEISRLFDCRIFNGVSQCTRESVRRDLDELHREGVRSLEIAVKTDSALAGAAGDPGSNGIVTNAANKNETGRYFDMRTCTGDPLASDKPQLTIGPGLTGPAADLFRAIDPGGQTPIYPPPPHCNTVGLSPIGRDLIGQMMNKGMIIDPDHMSQAARDSALDLLEKARYSGVISSHSWSTAPDEPRVLQLGGVVTPKTSAIGVNSNSSWFVGEHRRLRALRDPRYVFGFGIGSDMNGIARQPIPRPDQTTVQPVTYPFKSFDGKQTIEKMTTGQRTWDFNKDGVAQYGLYLDFLEELRNRADPTFVGDMLRGPEAYLQMWERAMGVPAKRPLSARARLGRAGIGKVGLDVATETLLRRAGQPPVRGPRTWRWDLQQRDGREAGQIAMVLSGGGRSVFVGSTGPEHEAAGVGPGDRLTRKLRRATRAFGGRGIRVRSAGKGVRFVYVVKRGRIASVGVTTTTATRTPAALRALVLQAQAPG